MDGQQLIRQWVESNTDFDPRFRVIECLTFPPGKPQEGVLSLTFKAVDTNNGGMAVIKVLDYNASTDPYRKLAFTRESTALERVLGKTRCQQLITSESKTLMPIPSSPDIKVPVYYITTQYLPVRMIDRFYTKSTDLANIIEKLETFRQVVLSLAQLHTEGIYHRDLKPDNIRGFKKDGRLQGTIIDYGTVAFQEEGPLNVPYPLWSVGAPVYSPPEALLHFSFGNTTEDRRLTRLSDLYALGAMLFELFHAERFHFHLHSLGVFSMIEAEKAARGEVKTSADRESFFAFVERLDNTVRKPRFSDFGFHVPKVLQPILNTMLHDLIAFDFRKRHSDLGKILVRIESCIKTLRNMQEDHLARERRKIMRAGHQ